VALGHVGHVGGYSVGDDADLDVLAVGQTQLAPQMGFFAQSSEHSAEINV